MRIRFHAWDICLVVLVLVHLLCSPYNKIEESFSTNAVRDLLRWLTDSQFKLEDFDHKIYPDVVPRTFIGAIPIAAALATIAKLYTNITGAALQGPLLQIIARVLVSALNCAAVIYFRRSFAQLFGRNAAWWLGAVFCTQFHLIYYASRLLPNFIIFAPVLLVNSALLRARARHDICIASLFALAAMFRAEIVVLAGAIGLIELLTGMQSIWQLARAGAGGTAAGAALSIIVDSFFYGEPVWPEAICFKFNVIDGKSSFWGVSPYHYYFLIAVPKLLLNPLLAVCCIAATLRAVAHFRRDRLAQLLIAHLLFIALYSILPHKEWRFICYSIPVLNAACALQIDQIMRRLKTSKFQRIIKLGILSTFAASFALSSAFLSVSSKNYPGGDAVTQLALLDHSESRSLHIDTYTWMTGGSLFQFDQLPDSWTIDRTMLYSEEEKAEIYRKFDWVLCEPNPAFYQSSNWKVEGRVNGFDKILIRKWNRKFPMSPPLVWPHYSDKIHILKHIPADIVEKTLLDTAAI